MILEVKHFPSNNTIAEISDFTVSESFMEIKGLSVKIESPEKIVFTPFNGGSYNYIDYNDNRYYLFIDPTVKDDNKKEKYTYNIEFKGFEFILTLISFNDIVQGGGNPTYTNGGIVSFFGGSATIAQFINANLEQYFGNTTTFRVVEDFSDSFQPFLHPDQYFNLINQSCWDAVKQINSVLGLNFFIETPINGTAKIRITDKTTTLQYVFRQGEGNGLYNIGKTVSKDDELLTVIRPYGGNRNIRPGYKKDSMPVDSSRYSPHLLLPDVNGYIQYEIRDEKAISKYGVRVKSVSDPFQGIFPSIQNATLGDVYGSPLPANGNDGVSLIGLNATDRIDRIIHSTFDEKSNFFKIYTTDLGFYLDKKEESEYFDPIKTILSGKTERIIIPSGQRKTYTLGSVVFNENVKTIGTFSSMNVSAIFNKSNIHNQVICTVDLYKDDVRFEGNSILLSNENKLIPSIYGDGTGPLEYKIIMELFSQYDEDIDISLTYSDFLIDIKSPYNKPKYLYYTPEDSVVSMQTGLYAGQEFKIQIDKVVKLDSSDPYYSKGARYSIELERKEDGTDEQGNPMLVPTEALKEGDFFALLGIYMPDTYENIAENRIYQAAIEYLTKNSIPKYTIPIEISVSYFVENPNEFINFKAGNRLKIWGENIDVDIESFTIQSYSLTYSKDNSYPKYNVTLSEIKEFGLLDRLNAITNTVSQGKKEQQYVGGGGGIAPGIPDLSVTDKRYLRKDQADIAEGYIDFAQGLNSLRKSTHEEGLQIGRRFTAGIIGGQGGYFDKDANGEIESLKIRTSLEVPTITFNNIDVISGDQVSTFAYGTIKDVDTASKIATVDLLSDERGTFKVNDICRGVFHNFEGDNTDVDYEDENGFVNYSGFSTTYFTPVEIIENIPGSFRFRYAIKSGTTVHPMLGMNVFAYGNFTDKNRQTITYTTRDYTRRLKNMNTWIIDPTRNIAMQEGLLEGLNIGGMEMHGYGTFSENNYFTGTQIQFTPEQEAALAGKDAYNVTLSRYEATVFVNADNVVENIKGQKNVYSGGSQVTTDGKDVVTNEFLLSTRIQASKGNTELFYSNVYTEGGYTVMLDAVGCNANIDGGVVNILDIYDFLDCRVNILVNCEGNIIFEKVFNINVIRDGSSNVIADIDNEVAPVAADQNGKVLLGLPVSTNVSMWYGLEDIPITKIELTIPSGVTANYVLTPEAKVLVTAITDNAEDTLNLGIKLTGIYNGKEYTKDLVFTVIKVRQGENAVIYDLLPSVSAIKRNKSNVNNPSSITCGLLKRDGKSNIETQLSVPSGYSMRYSIDTGSAYNYNINSSITISSATQNITFYLYYGALLVDKETIPIVVDGTDGTNGTPGTPGSDATRYWLISSVNQIGVSSAGYLQPSSFLVYSKYQTGNGSIGDNSSYYILQFRSNDKSSWTFVNYTQGSSLSVTPSMSYKYYRICLATAYTTSVTSSYIIDSKDVTIIKDGEDGANGATGSMPRYRGFWASGNTYVWNSSYRDIVIHTIGGNNYPYQVRNFGASVSAAPTIAGGSDTNWEGGIQYSFVAMDTALIDGANIAGFEFKNSVMQSKESAVEGSKNLILRGSDGYLFCRNANIGPWRVSSKAFYGEFIPGTSIASGYNPRIKLTSNLDLNSNRDLCNNTVSLKCTNIGCDNLYLYPSGQTLPTEGVSTVFSNTITSSNKKTEIVIYNSGGTKNTAMSIFGNVAITGDIANLGIPLYNTVPNESTGFDHNCCFISLSTSLTLPTGEALQNWFGNNPNFYKTYGTESTANLDAQVYDLYIIVAQWHSSNVIVYGNSSGNTDASSINGTPLYGIGVERTGYGRVTLPPGSCAHFKKVRRQWHLVNVN